MAAATGSPWPYPQPTWAFTTRSVPRIDGADLRFVRGDVRPVHREMRRAAGAGDVWVVGGELRYALKPDSPDPPDPRNPSAPPHPRGDAP